MFYSFDSLFNILYVRTMREVVIIASHFFFEVNFFCRYFGCLDKPSTTILLNILRVMASMLLK